MECCTLCSPSLASKVPQGQHSPHGVAQPYLALHSSTPMLNFPRAVLYILFESAKSLMISSAGCQPQEEIKSFHVLSLAYKHIASCLLLSDSQISSNEGEQTIHREMPTSESKKKHFQVKMWCTKLGENGRKQSPSYWDCEMYLRNVNKCSYFPQN